MLNIVNINTVRLEHQLRMAIIGYLEEDIVLSVLDLNPRVSERKDLYGDTFIDIDINYGMKTVNTQLITLPLQLLLSDSLTDYTRRVARFLYIVVETGVLDELRRLELESRGWSK